MNRTWARMVACLALVAAVGCGGDGATKPGATASGGGAAGGKPKLLFVTNSNADWWNAVEKGMLDGGEAFGCSVLMKRNNGETQGQVEKLREALAQSDVAGVAVSAIEADAPGVIDAMRELQKAGKVVIAIDSDVSDAASDARSAYIGTNNVKAGEAAGRAAKALRPEGGKVSLFVGKASAANAREREEGFFKGAGDKFVRLQTWEDQGDHNMAASNVKSAITKFPDMGLMVGIWSYNGPAVAGQVRENPEVRKRTTVVTFDLDEAAVDDVAGGSIDATVCQNPYEMGHQGVKVLKALIQKDDKTVREVLPDGKTRDTGVRVITPKADSPVVKAGKAAGDDVITIDEMKSWLVSKGLKSS